MFCYCLWVLPTERIFRICQNLPFPFRKNNFCTSHSTIIHNHKCFPQNNFFLGTVIHKETDDSLFFPLSKDPLPSIRRFITQSREMFPQRNQPSIIRYQFFLLPCLSPVQAVQANGRVIRIIFSILRPCKFFSGQKKKDFPDRSYKLLLPDDIHFF